MKHLLLAVAWIWVAVPLGWGVFQSVQKSLPLFREPVSVERPDASPRHSPRPITSRFPGDK